METRSYSMQCRNGSERFLSFCGACGVTIIPFIPVVWVPDQETVRSWSHSVGHDNVANRHAMA